MGEDDPTHLYSAYYNLELNDFILWFLLNLSALCFVHLILAFIKTKILAKHFMTIQLTAKHAVIIDKNGNIVEEEQKYEKVKTNKKKKKRKKRKKKKLAVVIEKKNEEIEPCKHEEEEKTFTLSEIEDVSGNPIK